MRTKLSLCVRGASTGGSSLSKHSALIAQHSVLFFAVCALLLAPCFPAQAQEAAKIPRIGYLGPASTTTRIEAFLQGLRELGYIEGRNIAIEYRYAEGKRDNFPALAADLLRLKVDVIVTLGSTGTRTAREATSKIPIVMANDPDPVGSGFVASLARPGGNITGLSALAPELSGKRLELLNETLPGLSRVAVLGTPDSPGNVQNLKETELAARALGVTLRYLEVLSPGDIEAAFHAATKGRAEAVTALGSFLQVIQRTRIAELAVKSRLASMYPQSEFVEAGGLMSYGVSRDDMARRAATYVDKILKGAKPAELPVEQAAKFEFIVNLRAAKQIGLTVPPNVLARADRVIR